MVTRCFHWCVVILPLLRYHKSRKSRSDKWLAIIVRSQKVYKCAPCVLPKKCPLYGEREAWSSGEQDSTEVPDFALRAFCPIGILLGIAFPKPCPTQPEGCGNLARRQSFTSLSPRKVKNIFAYLPFSNAFDAYTVERNFFESVPPTRSKKRVVK